MLYAIRRIKNPRIVLVITLSPIVVPSHHIGM